MLDKSKKQKDETAKEDEFQKNEYVKDCSNQTLECFLNGLIIFKRGKKDSEVTEPEKPVSLIFQELVLVKMILPLMYRNICRRNYLLFPHQ